MHALTIFSASMLVYASLMHGQIRTALLESNSTADCADATSPIECPGPQAVFDSVRAYIIVIPAAIGLATLCMLLLAWKLLRSFGWTVFKLLGASLQLKKMFEWYQVFVCFLKFDVFFFVRSTSAV